MENSKIYQPKTLQRLVAETLMHIPDMKLNKCTEIPKILKEYIQEVWSLELIEWLKKPDDLVEDTDKFLYPVFFPSLMEEEDYRGGL